jgi:2-polyprenyl-3-methyl-5-hydroxy-6-metoxy-1,4-benzoquinol methylase
MSSIFRDGEVKKSSGLFQEETPLFNPTSFNDGQQQVVGFCNGYSMEERWKEETPLFRDIILSQLKGDETILDYGCGVGRLAKEIIDLFPNVKIVGMDTSSEMRKLAEEYVDSDRFTTCSPEELGDRKFDFTYCVYVLQHILPEFIDNAVKQVSNSSDNLLLVNSVARMYASPQGFVNDGYDVLGEVAKNFDKSAWAIPPFALINNPLIRKMFMGSVCAGPEGNTEHYAFLFSK